MSKQSYRSSQGDLQSPDFDRLLGWLSLISLIGLV